MQAVFLTTKDLIDRHWWSVASLLHDAVGQVSDEYTLEDLAAMVESGDVIAGLALDGDTPVMAMVFRFVRYPRTQSIHIMALGGRNLAVVAVTFWQQFVEWAQESGVTRIDACTQPAMTRVLRGMGFKHRYDFLRMEV